MKYWEFLLAIGCWELVKAGSRRLKLLRRCEVCGKRLYKNVGELPGTADEWVKATGKKKYYHLSCFLDTKEMSGLLQLKDASVTGKVVSKDASV